MSNFNGPHPEGMGSSRMPVGVKYGKDYLLRPPQLLVTGVPQDHYNSHECPAGTMKMDIRGSGAGRGDY